MQLNRIVRIGIIQFNCRELELNLIQLGSPNAYEAYSGAVFVLFFPHKRDRSCHADRAGRHRFSPIYSNWQFSVALKWIHILDLIIALVSTIGGARRVHNGGREPRVFPLFLLLFRTLFHCSALDQLSFFTDFDWLFPVFTVFGAAGTRDGWALDIQRCRRSLIFTLATDSIEDGVLWVAMVCYGVV